MTTNQEFASAPARDSDRIDAFEDRLIGALNEAGMLMMTSLGHRAGLFEAMKEAPPMTSEALASRTELNERYVREWLGAMVAAKVVDMDATDATYRLPAEHAARLTDWDGVNLAVYAQFLSVLGAVEDDILNCFRQGGGVPYERYARFHEVMADDSAQTVLPALFDAILPLIPGLDERLQRGIRMLDAGCGRGRALVLLGERYPHSQFTGFDLSQEAIQWARARAAEAGLDNVAFEVRDLSEFDRTAAEAAFDFVTTFDAIHDQARPLSVLKGIRRSLAPGGVYLAQDIRGSSHPDQDRENPLGAFLYAVSCMHCMTVSLAQGGEGLGTMWGRERALDYIARAGFADVQVYELPHDIQNDYFVCRP